MRINYMHFLARTGKEVYCMGESHDGKQFVLTDVLDAEGGRVEGITESEMSTIEIRGWQEFFENITEHKIMRG